MPGRSTRSSVGEVGVLLEDLDAVAVVEEVRGDGRADAAASGDDDAHQGTLASRSSSSREGVAEDDELHHVVLLADERRDVDAGLVAPHDRGDLDAPGVLELVEVPARPVVGQDPLDEEEACRWRRATRRESSSGMSQRSTWVVVQVTVATVGMPSRW